MDSKAVTIYQYQLVQRFPIKTKDNIIYVLLLLIAAILFIAIDKSLAQLVSLLLGFLFIHLIYVGIIVLDLTMRHRHPWRHWAWRWQFPWVGLLPKQTMAMGTFAAMHWRLLAIGLAIICSLLPWASPLLIGQLLFLHLWMLLPRFIIILFCHVPATDLIKLERKRISHYSS